MNGKPYVVTIMGEISVDTTVAVIAESEEEAGRHGSARSARRYDTLVAPRTSL